MLEAMSFRQYQEWLAFYKIRNEDMPKPSGGGESPRPTAGYGTSREGQQRMSADIIRSLTGYNNRRARAQGRG